MVNQKMDAHIGHSGSWKLKQVLFNSYLKNIWISFKTQIKTDKIRKKSYHRFNRRHQVSIRRLNAVTEAWTLSTPVKPTIFEINVGAVVQNVGFPGVSELILTG